MSKQDKDIQKTIETLMPLIIVQGLPNILMAVRGICSVMKDEFEERKILKEAAYWNKADTLLEPVIEKLKAIDIKQ
jgi:hypothetical protein